MQVLSPQCPSAILRISPERIAGRSDCPLQSEAARRSGVDAGGETEGVALQAKLGPVADPCSVLGPVGPYWRGRYGLRDGCQVVCGTGDNPGALVGEARSREWVRRGRGGAGRGQIRATRGP